MHPRLLYFSLMLLLGYSSLLAQESAQRGLSVPPKSAPVISNAPVPAVPVPATPVVVAPAPSTASMGPLSSGENDYVLVVGDVIELNIFREPDLNTSATIARDGTVQLPLVREVELANLTIRDAREKLRGMYNSQFLIDPQVFLNVVKYAQRKFTIMGQVARPGSYELQGGERMDVLEAIGLAGGFTRIANRGRIVVQRKEDGGVSTLRVNAKRVQSGQEDPVEIQPGDVITVSESWF